MFKTDGLACRVATPNRELAFSHRQATNVWRKALGVTSMTRSRVEETCRVTPSRPRLKRVDARSVEISDVPLQRERFAAARSREIDAELNRLLSRGAECVANKGLVLLDNAIATGATAPEPNIQVAETIASRGAVGQERNQPNALRNPKKRQLEERFGHMEPLPVKKPRVDRCETDGSSQSMRATSETAVDRRPMRWDKEPQTASFRTDLRHKMARLAVRNTPVTSFSPPPSDNPFTGPSAWMSATRDNDDMDIDEVRVSYASNVSTRQVRGLERDVPHQRGVRHPAPVPNS